MSGNREIKRLFPQAKLYTGTAVERMVRDVFPQGIQRSEAFLATGKAAPNEVAATPFVTLVPGHGAPMERPQFLACRAAFEAYTDCIASIDEKAVCAARWENSLPKASAYPRAGEMAAAYVEFPRSSGGNAPMCRAP